MHSKVRAALLALSLAALLYCLYSVNLASDALQYAVAAPAPPEEAGEGETKEQPELLALVSTFATLAENLHGVVTDCTLLSLTGNAQFSADSGAQAGARLTGVYGVSNKALLCGRRIYWEEMLSGAPVAVLDEQLALALFRVGDPLDRTFTCSGVVYRVIGVALNTRGAGDNAPYGAQVPLLSLQNVQADALVAQAMPVPGAGAYSAFKAAMEAWRAGGDLYSLAKEKTGALLPARTLACCSAFALCIFLIRQWVKLVKREFAAFRERLRVQYAVKLLPRAFALSALFALAFGTLLFAGYFTLKFLIAPVYVFPEWVPAVPVEWAEIAKVFWQNRESGARIAQLRTPDMLRLRFFGKVTGFASAISAVCLAGFRRRA